MVIGHQVCGPIKGKYSPVLCVPRGLSKFVTFTNVASKPLHLILSYSLSDIPGSLTLTPLKHNVLLLLGHLLQHIHKVSLLPHNLL